jgi:hypothetical protein
LLVGIISSAVDTGRLFSIYPEFRHIRVDKWVIAAAVGVAFLTVVLTFILVLKRPRKHARLIREVRGAYTQALLASNLNPKLFRRDHA